MRRVLVIAVLAVFMATPVFAGAPEVMTIVKQMKEVFEPSRASLRTLLVTSMDSKGETLQWQIGEARKRLPNGKRILLVMLGPAEVKGFASLMWEREGKDSPILVYLPFMKRVREIIGMRAYDSFAATEFTYADLGFIPVHEGYKLLGEEERDGVRVYRIEETVPQERRYYSRVVTWVGADTMLPRERNYYDIAGRLWKTEVFRDVATVDGMPTPMDVVMTDVQQGYKTEMKIIKINYDGNVPDEVFDPGRLPKVADFSFWQTVSPRETGSK
jgi:hypothetical protein